MTNKDLIAWLLEGDVAIQYQVWRDLLNEDRPDLRNRIATEGWGARFLSLQRKDGHWGKSFYQPKWISTHYTLLDLRNLEIAPNHESIKDTIELILQQNKGPDGGVSPFTEIQDSDVCVNGMFLNYACYFQAKEAGLESVVDFILSQKMKDGGFNCRFNRSGAVHSSLHSTISLVEGIRSYHLNGYTYRLKELLNAEASSREFILCHQLYLSDRTGEIINKNFLMLSYPSRWKYDILRALDYFSLARVKYEQRMQAAIEVLKVKRRKDGRWPVQAKHPGQTHFDMEKTGAASRWNTLRALRVLGFWNK